MAEFDHGWLKEHIRDIPDFPKQGIVFKDITPLLADKKAFSYTVDAIAHHFDRDQVDKVLGIEARGFIVAAPLAYRFTAGLIPVRKKGKLPWQVESEEYELEYGTDALEVHQDAITPGERILIVDDVLATGGTAKAVATLTERCGGKVAGIATIMELSFLDGRARIGDYEYFSLISY
ncbi:MAG TPA: adenine phosphoribosyltransferase [Actinomycetota bacterium]|jgi:adenine phosphoribosyltransferase|nr:adenine phosphoribosyltransferase [Actinomycetota bacterium]